MDPAPALPLPPTPTPQRVWNEDLSVFLPFPPSGAATSLANLAVTGAVLLEPDPYELAVGGARESAPTLQQSPSCQMCSFILLNALCVYVMFQNTRGFFLFREAFEKKNNGSERARKKEE